MQPNYFQQLNQLLKSYESAIPYLIIDQKRLDKNIKALQNLTRKDLEVRIVVKSLPSIPLLDYIRKQLQTNRLMVFHAPILSILSEHYSDEINILIGKPMPIQTARFYYQTLKAKHGFEPSQQLQWLVDTTQRTQQYIDLAKSIGQKIQLNIELDVGLHRGGFATLESLSEVLNLIEKHQEYVEFSGFMGYDPHVVNLPKILRSPQKAFQMANGFYQNCIKLVKEKHSNLWNDKLTFNGGGSPTLALHAAQSSPINEVAVGSALVKPTHFDVPTLANFQPAAFIATPILKQFKNTNLPLLEGLKSILNIFKPSFKNSYFIYGGYWKAAYYYPSDAKENQVFGSSTNQSMINSKMELKVDDFVFLRPSQSEFVFLQFGGILLVNAGRVMEKWRVLRQD